MKMSELESTLMKERDALIDERDNLRAELAEAKAEIAEHDNAVEIVQAEASTYAKSVQRLQKAFDDQCNASRMDAAEIERLKKESAKLREEIYTKEKWENGQNAKLEENNRQLRSELDVANSAISFLSDMLSEPQAAIAVKMNKLAKSVQRLQKAFDDQCNASRMDAAEIERLKKENERLVELCTNVHDRLLRGDSDMDLLKMLCEGWQKAGGAIPVPDWLRERMERLAAQPKPSIERVRKQLRASGEQGGAE